MNRNFVIFGAAPFSAAPLLAVLSLAVLLSAAAVTATARASAAGTPGVRGVELEFPPCSTPPYDSQAVLQALAIELASDNVQPTLARSAATTSPGVSSPAAIAERKSARVVMAIPTCAADADPVDVAISDGRPPPIARRSVTLRDVPRPARARTLALAIAEALRPSLSQTAAQPDAGSTPTPERAPAQPLDALSPSTSAANEARGAELPRFGVAGLGRAATGGGPFAYGLELTSRLRISGPFAVALEGSYTGSTASAEFTDLDIAVWNVMAGLDWLVPAVPGLSVGPRLGLSYVNPSHAEASNPRSTDFSSFFALSPIPSSLLAMLGVRAALDVPIAAGFSAGVALQAQYALNDVPQYRTSAGYVLPGALEAYDPPTSLEVTPLGLDGLLLSASAGLTLQL